MDVENFAIISTSNEEPSIDRKPQWIRVKLPTGKKYTELRNVVDR